MIFGFYTLGELTSLTFDLPVPGIVLGMLLLAGAVRGLAMALSGFFTALLLPYLIEVI